MTGTLGHELTPAAADDREHLRNRMPARGFTANRWPGEPLRLPQNARVTDTERLRPGAGPVVHVAGT